MNFGEWEGRHYDAIEAEDKERAHLVQQLDDRGAPAESHHDFVARVRDWIRPTALTR